MPIRILHFSDFHISPSTLKESEGILNYMMKALVKISQEQPIDLVIFSGDMLKEGGKEFGSISEGFNTFKEKVITPLLDSLSLPPSRFIFTPGNHDINRDADSKWVEPGVFEQSKTLEGIISLIKGPDVEDYTKRVNDFKTFEKEYYSCLDDLKYSYGKFVSTFEFNIKGVQIGISSLNSVWRCGENDNGKICLGLNQITENTAHLEDKDLRIAVTHYHYNDLQKVESQEVLGKLSKEFNVLFSGHSHSGFSQLIIPNIEYYLLDINTAGTLSGNVYEKDGRYKNAFQIIDFYKDDKYQIRKFVQQKFQEFTLSQGEYDNGVKTVIIPNSQEKKQLHELQSVLNKQEETIAFNREIRPFEPLHSFISSDRGKTVTEGDFIVSEHIRTILEAIRDDSSSHIRLMALSGMGKTRIAFEALKDTKNVYYSPNGDCGIGLSRLLSSGKAIGALIVDNCNHSQLLEIQCRIKECEIHPKLISICNIMTSTERETSGKLLELVPSNTKSVVEKMIERESCLCSNKELSELIQEKSGNIPYMALLLINAYKNNRTLSIDNRDETLSKLLAGRGGSVSDSSAKVLKSISLFEPLGTSGNIEDEYNFITSEPSIHHILLSEKSVQQAFIDTINEYEKRQLVEHTDFAIRVRPKPLAEWLADSWIREYKSSFPAMLESIMSQKTELSTRLCAALNRRFKGMADDYPDAKELFDYLNNTEDGPFHNERIAFSVAGSQLFLSMGIVSPVAVSVNLYTLLKDKDADWLKVNLSGDVRRQIVWALENLVKYEDAFPYSSKALAILSLSENEQLANNATSLFVQLFHILLSGTRANLKARVSILQELRSDERYAELIIQCIGAAFKSRDFHRSITNGVREIGDTPSDYNPSGQEIRQYWQDCSDVLEYTTEQYPSTLPSTISMLPNLVYDFSSAHGMPLMFRLISYVAEKVAYDWVEMRDALSSYIHFWSEKDNPDNIETARQWMDRLTPKTFYGRLLSAQKDMRYDRDIDASSYNDHRLEQMHPYAVEFIDKEIYLNNTEVSLIVDDKDFLNIWFVKEVSNIIGENHNTKAKLLSSLYGIILKRPKDFESRFIVDICRVLNDITAIKSFQENLHEKGYYRISSSLVALIDDAGHSNLNYVIDNYIRGLYDNMCVSRYLSNYPYCNPISVVDIFNELHNGGVDDYEVNYPFFLDHLAFGEHEKFEEMGIMTSVKKILLSYVFDSEPSHGHTAIEIVHTMDSILTKTFCPEFAKDVQFKIISTLSGDSFFDRPFDTIYHTLLPKYQDYLLDELLDAVAAEDERFGFFFRMYHQLGSGFGFGYGPLFLCDIERIKQSCFKYPEVMPWRLAMMCPVYNFSDDGRAVSFSDFFIWLCDNFGDNVRVLDEFSANMGTYSWTGIGGMSDFIGQKIPFFEPLKNHAKKAVREWATTRQEAAINEVKFEKGKESYESMIYS